MPLLIRQAGFLTVATERALASEYSLIYVCSSILSNAYTHHMGIVEKNSRISFSKMLVCCFVKSAYSEIQRLFKFSPWNTQCHHKSTAIFSEKPILLSGRKVEPFLVDTRMLVYNVFSILSAFLAISCFSFKHL